MNLPGSCKAVTECFAVIAPAISHAVDLISDNRTKIKDTHDVISQHNVASSLDDKFHKKVRYFRY